MASFTGMPGANSLLDLLQPAMQGGQQVAPDMHVASRLLGGSSADVLGNPTYEQILAALPTSGTGQGTSSAQDYAREIFRDYYTPGGSTWLGDTGQAYAVNNDINYSGAGSTGNNWYPGAEPGQYNTGASSGFTIGGTDPFAGQSSVSGVAPGMLGTSLNKLPSRTRNVLGPAVARHVISSEGTGKSNRGTGLFYPGSVAYAPYREPHVRPQGEGEWLGNQVRDAWGRLLGAAGGAQGYEVT